MFELIGLVFGGASRLFQHWMDMQDKQRERDHEATMYDKQITLAEKRMEQDMAIHQVDAQTAREQAEASELAAALAAQSSEAKEAGGFVLQFSAAIRPLLTFWHCIAIYTLVKVAMFLVAANGGLPWQQVILSIYTDADRALCFSIVSYWFADRSLRNRFK